MTSATIDFDRVDEQGPQTYSGTFEIPNTELDRAEIAGMGNIAIEAHVSQGHLEGEYVAEGKSTATIDLACSRCVEPFPFANNSTFHIRFRPRPEISAENEEIEITNKEELDVEFYSERQIPLRDLAFEQLQLVIPMKPLCDEGCLGLCPTCGANRLREKCSCEAALIDDRWGVLKGIRDELARKKDI